MSWARRLPIACGLALVAGSVGCSSGGPAVTDGVVVSPSATLRQGQDGVSIVVTRAAGGLAGATTFDLGGLVAARQPQSTDSRLVLAVSVPHGAALGARTLAFTDTRGAVSLPSVVDVGPVAAATTGVDTNLGTTDAPFRTVARAVQAAGAGDTIQLSDGAYDANAGDTWSYTAPPGLTIAGQSQAGTILSGPLSDGAATPGTTALVAPAGLTLKSLTLNAFDTAVSATGPGALALDDVAVSGALTTGVSADAANVAVTVSGGAVGAQQDGLLLGDHCSSCTLDVANAALVGAVMGGHTIEVSAMASGSRVTLDKTDVRGDISVMDATATMTVTTSTLEESGSDAQAMIDFGGQALDVTGSTITLEADNFGINFAGGTLSLSGVTIAGGRYGVYQLAGEAKARGTKIRDYGYMGYYLAQGNLDLGTATEAGDDAFSTSTTGPTVFGLYVDGVTRPVTSSNTTFNGVEPAAGTQAATDTDTIDVPGEYFINNDKAISFFTL